MHQGKVENFVGMTPEASHDLITELLDEALKPEFVYRHKWRLGDMLIWDDRASMHQAYTNYDLAENRVLYRIVAGPERPV
jgi:taurine dioxygenase